MTIWFLVRDTARCKGWVVPESGHGGPSGRHQIHGANNVLVSIHSDAADFSPLGVLAMYQGFQP